MSALGWVTLAFLAGCILFAAGMAIGASIAVSRRSTRTGLRAHEDEAIALTKEAGPCNPT